MLINFFLSTILRTFAQEIKNHHSIMSKISIKPMELERMTPREMAEVICDMSFKSRFSYPVRFITLDGGRTFTSSILSDDIIILHEECRDEIIDVHKEPTVDEMEETLVTMCHLSEGEGIGYDYQNSKWEAKKDPAKASSLHFSAEAYEQLRQAERNR